MCFFWKYCRELIEDGYIYCAVPPLYKVVKGKENYYLLDDKALENFKNKNKNSKLIVQRFKGLGEMNPDQLSETTMSKENRILKRITISDMSKLEKVMNILMRDSDSSGRKEFIEKNSHKSEIEV
ncbi:MAG: hypothetical protein HUJ68_04970 [Clostridia bacterium]|nr:hypothetical protein [Clostridia bacterium]